MGTRRHQSVASLCAGYLQPRGVSLQPQRWLCELGVSSSDSLLLCCAMGTPEKTLYSLHTP